MKRGARDERPEADALGDGRERRQHRQSLPRSSLLTTVAAVEEMISEPDRVEANVLCRPGHRHVLRPANVALDLGQLDADCQRAHRVFAMRSE